MMTDEIACTTANGGADQRAPYRALPPPPISAPAVAPACGTDARAFLCVVALLQFVSNTAMGRV